MPNLLTGVLVPPSHLGQANTHLAKKIAKPFVKAARFICKQLNLVQVKPQNSYSQPKKTQLSKAAEERLSQAASSTFHAPSAKRPKPVTKTDAFTDSNASVASAKTHKAHNKSKATTYLRDIALNPRAKAVSHSSLKNEETERLVPAKHSLNRDAISTEIDQNKNVRPTADVLKDAVKAADLKALKPLLSTMNLEKQITQRLSNQLLMLAARQGSVEVLNLLLNQDQIKVDTQIGQKLLVIAGEHKNTEIVDSLLSDKVFVKTIFSHEFVNLSIKQGYEYLSLKLINATRLIYPNQTQKDYEDRCFSFALKASEVDHLNLVRNIIDNSGYQPGENAGRDYMIMRFLCDFDKPGSSKLLGCFLNDDRFDPSIFHNGSLEDAFLSKRLDIVKVLLTDIRLLKNLFIDQAIELEPILSECFQDLNWHPKFSFSELKQLFKHLQLRNGLLTVNLDQKLLPVVQHALEIRHGKAVFEAEKISKVFQQKGFDQYFIAAKVYEHYGCDLFPLQSDHIKKISIAKLIDQWEKEPL